MKSDPNAKHILFITSSRIGDAVLSFGILDELVKANPGAEFTIVCGPLVTSFFEGFPALHQVIALKKKPYNKHWFELWRQLSKTKFDIIVDLRNSAVSRVLRAKQRYIHGPQINKNKHKVEQNAQVLELSNAPAPRLWPSAGQLKKAAEFIPEGSPVLGVGPTANWAGKTWPADRFMDIIQWLCAEDGLMPNARVAVFAAPGEEKAAYEVLRSIPEGRSIDLVAKADPATAAACLARCSFYIGNDSGLMHCAAATGRPTLGLFGPSYPALYAPWGQHTTYVATPESFDQLISFPGYNPKTVGTLMESLTTDMVREHIQKSWASLMPSSS